MTIDPQPETTHKTPHESVILGLILFLFIVLAVGFSGGPLFEGPDEAAHYTFIRYIQRHHALPDQAGDPSGQFHQAPLYYLLMQPAAWFFPDPEFTRDQLRENPNHGYAIRSPGNDNKNLYLHYRDESFPYHTQTSRAVHALRLFSILIGSMTIVLGIGITRMIWPMHPYRRLLVTILLATWPQFIYTSSVINNDSLAILLGTAALWCILRQQKNPSWRNAALLGGVLGFALLTKASLLVLAIPTGIMILLELRKQWRYAIAALVLTILIAGWWYLRNYLDYGDFIGLNAMYITWPGQVVDTSQKSRWLIGLSNAPYAYGSIWARFGQGAVSVAGWIYRFYDFLVLLACSGLLFRAIHANKDLITKTPQTRQGIVIFIFAGTWILSIVSSAGVATAGNQGRYLFPGIVAWAMLLALGIDTLFWKMNKAFPLLVIGASLTIVSASTLFLGFYPAYQAIVIPEIIERPLRIRYGDAAELIGIAPAELSARPGERIVIELYWEALQSASPTLQTYLHAGGAEDFLWRDSIPGNGNYPADNWQTGDTWGERYVISIPETVEAGTEYIIVGGLYDPALGQALEAYDSMGNSLSNTPWLGTLVIKP